MNPPRRQQLKKVSIKIKPSSLLILIIHFPTNSSPRTCFQSFISLFQDLWIPSISSPDPTEYLCDLSPLNNKEMLQILPPSPLIIPKEIRFAIKTLNKHSSPGLDGFSSQFYNSLPSIIPLLTQSFNNTSIR